MIWTQPFELPLIRHVAEAIIADIVGPAGLQFGDHYVAKAPTLFGSVGLSITKVRASVTDLTVLKASAGGHGISFSVGTGRAQGSTALTLLTIGGLLCQELVHQKQCGRDPTSFAMAAAVQTDWSANKPPHPSPEEWLRGYLGTVYEFEAHAEQVACELWLADTISGVSPRKSERLSAVTQSEPLRRIRERLIPSGTPSALVVQWFDLLETKMNEALGGW
ncbi:MAG: hypothetical protein JWL96_4576 [Sphingomonas bacterium]|uniref:hypothetical protein n=1 Tax=Sphingomonas bacterium TaxID=1895847 RepID=UPI00261B8F00|nr:hypothetical protein [Sphingomonas bacterium]MDB5712506.1 hypothetical protein [Sphingomonas bacterium]